MTKNLSLESFSSLRLYRFNIDGQDRHDKIGIPSGFLIPELSCSSCLSMFIFLCEQGLSLAAVRQILPLELAL